MKQFFDRFSRWIVALVVALAAALGAAGGASYTGAIAGKASHIYQLTSVTSLIAGTSVAAGTTVGAGAAVTAGTSVTAGTFVTATTTLNGRKLALVYGAPMTCANGATITPTNSYQQLTAAGTVEVTLAVASRVTGEILILEDMVAQQITIKDVNVYGAGDCALNIGDTMMFVFDGTYWVELARKDN